MVEESRLSVREGAEAVGCQRRIEVEYMRELEITQVEVGECVFRQQDLVCS